MRVLITGGLGVNGCWVTRQFLEAGHEVVVFDNRPDFSLTRDISGRFEFVEGDILDSDSLARTLKERRIERVCHLAAIYPSACDEAPLRGFEINALASVRLLEAARIAGVRRVVFTSSVAALSPFPKMPAGEVLRVDESYPSCPGDSGVYGATKVAAELMGMNYARLYGIEFAALRFASIYGPGKLAPRHGDASMFVIPNVIVHALAGKRISLPYSSKQPFDLVYADDVADSIVRACVADTLPHSIYHIGAGRTYALGEFCDAVSAAIPGAKIEFAQESRGGTRSAWYFDISRAGRDFGYRPRYTPESAIRHWLDWSTKLGI